MIHLIEIFFESTLVATNFKSIGHLKECMCLAVPGKIVSKDGDEAVIDFGGVTRKANISLVDAGVGDYIIVHAGYAIQVLDESEAKENLRIWEELLGATE